LLAHSRHLEQASKQTSKKKLLCPSTRAKRNLTKKPLTRLVGITILHCLPPAHSHLTQYTTKQKYPPLRHRQLSHRSTVLLGSVPSPTHLARLLPIHHLLLTQHHRLASLYTSGLRGSLQSSSIHLPLDWFYLSFHRDTPKFCVLQPFFDSLIIPSPPFSCATLSLLSTRKVTLNNTYFSII
jgi:hypothetical protein